MAKSRNRKPSTAALSSRRRMACSPSAFLARHRTGRASVASTDEHTHPALSVRCAAWRSPPPLCAASEWGTLDWQLRSPIPGSRGMPPASSRCSWDFHNANLPLFSPTPATWCLLSTRRSASGLSCGEERAARTRHTICARPAYFPTWPWETFWTRPHFGSFPVGTVMSSALDLDALSASLRQTIALGGAAQKKAIKRLHVVEGFRTSSVDPFWMILSVIPVLPPELRPLIRLDGGKFASSDLNVLYERVISRNNRLKRFICLKSPEVILNNEKRLQQEACDALLDNGHRNRPITGSGGQPLKSLTDAISGKQGRLRKNLLGKRVDYSGRSVIVGDPQLSLHQCGLPTKMCLELFKPFLIRKLLERHYAPNARVAKRMVERTRKPDPILWDLLEEVMSDRLVLLNRAPTLHRLSIQAFEAVRVEGNAITLHPLVCSAFNADFDGDQMAVHLPLSDEAQAEARALLLSTRNLRSPASGDPSISISQDIVLGLFYLTQDRPGRKSAGRVFADASEAMLALDADVIDLHTRIFVRTPDQTIYEAPGSGTARPGHKGIETTAGRLLFNDALPEQLRFKNYAMTKDHLKLLVVECLETCGPEVTAQVADRLKTLGFHYATRSGISFAISDIKVPPEKHEVLVASDAEAEAVEETYRAGMITAEERYRQLIEVWTRATDAISTKLEAPLDPWGSLATIIKSGATKAKFQQIRQLSGIRGLMANPSGDIIPVPVKGNCLEGLKVWELFIAASGARKGFMDRSLNTARS